MLPKVLAWLNETGDSEGADEVLEQLQETLSRAYDFDGYKLAKELEDDHYWDADEELVDIMSGAHWVVYDITQRRVAEWVKENDIKPTFAVGDHVEFESARTKQAGTIVKVNGHEATYTIQEDGKQYKTPREGDEFREGILVPFERVVGLSPAVLAQG